MDLGAPFRLIVDAALPPRCPGCGAVTIAAHRFCADCWGQLRFLAPPWCASCHTPFSYDRGADARCGRCIAHPPKHAGIRAAVAYDDIPKAIVLRLKYGGHLAYAETVARLMARLMPDPADLIVPVPLHRWRIWRRGFNQSAVIGAAIARRSDVPIDVSLLRRTRATPVLRGLGARSRAEAVRKAFAVSPDRRSRVKGRSVVLIDDVYTSGATTAACTDVLLKAGAARVTILCWARVLDPAAVD